MLLTSSFALLLSTAALGTVETTTVQYVTPQGVFTKTTTLPQTKGGIFAATFPNPNPSPSSLRWTYPNGVAGPWITQDVSVGNRGTFAWLGQNQNAERVTLVSTTDDQAPALPIWEDVLPNPDYVEVAAADKAPVCAVVNRDFPNGLFEVRLYSAFSPIAVASVLVPTQGDVEVAISDDGERVAIGYTDLSGIGSVDVYDTLGGSALVFVTTIVAAPSAASAFREHDLSADGQVVLLATQNTDQLFDATTGTPIFVDSSTVSIDSHAIDGDGDTFVRGGFDVGVWKESGGTYNRILNFKDTQNFGFFVATACDVSADGSTFVAAAYDATNSNKMRVYCWTLTQTTATLKWRFVSNGLGSVQDSPQTVSVSDDGKFIAVASWGTGNNAHPEVMLFDREVGIVPVANIDTPGSPFDCDLSGDGQFLVAGTKAVHANSLGSGGEGYSLDRGAQGFRMFGTTSIGRTFALEFGGAPGETLLLAASFGLAPTPIASGSFAGTFDLDPGLMFLTPTPIGAFPGSGIIAFSTVVPLVPAAVGVTVHAQAIRTGGFPACDNHVSMPITP